MFFPSGSFSHQLYAAIAATIGAFGLGTVLGYSALAVPDINERVRQNETDFDYLDSNEKSWISSIINLGAALAVLFTGILVEVIGRKLTMLLLSPPFVLGWLFIAFAKSHTMLMVGRFATGFCGGGFSLVAPLFIGETTQDRIRGALTCSFQIMVTLGVLFSYVVSSFMNFKWLAIVCGFVPMVFLAVMIFIPESYRYLFVKGKPQAATRSLCWFRNKYSADEVEGELKIIQSSADELNGKENTWRDLLEWHHFYPSFILVSLMVFQQLSGINALVFYSGEIFDTSDSMISDNVTTVIVGLVQFLATCCCVPLVDTVGRRILLLASSAVMAVSLLILGVFYQMKDDGRVENLQIMTWLPLLSLMLFMFSYSIGYGPVPWILLGELIPLKVKARVAVIATGSGWLISFIITKFFEAVKDAITMQWCCWMFAIVAIVDFIFVFLLLPETKGKSLEEIQKLFRNHNHNHIQNHNTTIRNDCNAHNCNYN